MQTKTCPSCGAEVPAAASRCRECLHDFDEPVRKAGGGAMPLLIAVAAMAIVGAATFWYLSQQPTDQRILVDEESHTIQWVTRYQDGKLSTDRLPFSDVEKVVYVVTSTGSHEIYAVTRTGERKLIQQHPDRNLQLDAQNYADVMDKPMEVEDKTFGFQK